MYGKIFKSIYYGSLAENGDARDLFICLCAHSDQDGFVDMNLASIGRVLRWSEERLAEAAQVLMAPDPNSGTPDLEGRRIVANGLIARGVKVVNYEKYRKMQSDEERRTYQKAYYERRKVSTSLNIPQHSSTDSRQVEGEVEGEVEAEQIQLPCATALRVRRGVKRKALENGEHLPEGEITADQAFEEIFWPEYPRKKDKEPARKAWKALKLKDTDEAQILAIMKALRRDVKEEWRDRPPDKIPYGATWLHRKGWLDG